MANRVFTSHQLLEQLSLFGRHFAVKSEDVASSRLKDVIVGGAGWLEIGANCGWRLRPLGNRVSTRLTAQTTFFPPYCRPLFSV